MERNEILAEIFATDEEAEAFFTRLLATYGKINGLMDEAGKLVPPEQRPALRKEMLARFDSDVKAIEAEMDISPEENAAINEAVEELWNMLVGPLMDMEAEGKKPN